MSLTATTGTAGGSAGDAGGHALSLEEVSFAYGRHRVLDRVRMHVRRGQFVALTGPNGSGKSTLVRIALGLTRPQAGTVRLLGVSPARLSERWRVGYVPQRPAVTEHFPATVEEVVASGGMARRGWARRLTAEGRARVDRALDAVALTELRRVPVSTLSGGEQQRAFIARALVSEPELLVLDEPIAGVDAGSQARFREVLVSRCRDHGVAVLLVSHELGAVADDLDRLLVLRRGAIAFDGAPAELTRAGVSLGVHSTDLPVWLEGIG